MGQVVWGGLNKIANNEPIFCYWWIYRI